MKIVTWNLRCVYDHCDGINNFIHRAGFIYDKIMKEKPSVIAFQEVVEKSLEMLKKMLPEYEFVGGMRSANYDNEGLYIAYLKEEFMPLGFDLFWLSPTPYVAGSRFLDQSDCPRVCNYLRLLDKASKKNINMFNVHLDHVSDKAMVDGINVILKYIENNKERVDKDSTVILGDFNSIENSEPILLMNEQTWLTDVTKCVMASYHGFGERKNDKGEFEPNKIDYIFLSKTLKECVDKVATWEDKVSGIYLSDHYPICVELNTNK